MGIKFTNNAEGTLTAGVGAGDTTNMTLTAGDGLLFPTIVLASGDYFYATLVDSSGNREIVQVTEHQSGTDVFQTYVRAQDDTSAIAFAIGDKVQIRIPKIVVEAFRDDIVTNAAGIATNVSDITTLAARVTVNETDLAGTTNAGSIPGPSGTKMYFYQDTAPSQWTIDTGPADSLLAVKGGSQAYNSTGGQVLGSWTPTTHVHTGPSHTHTGPSHTHTGPSHTHTGPSHTHTGGSHTLITSEVPAHTHTMNGRYNSQDQNSTGVQASNAAGGSAASPAPFSSSSGGGGSHSHGATSADGTGATGAEGTGATGAEGTGATGSSGTANTGSSSAPSTDRSQAAVGIMATKD